MSKAPLEKSWKSRSQDSATYTCADGLHLRCHFKAFEIYEEVNPETDEGGETLAPENGIRVLSGRPPTIFVNQTWMSRDMKKIIERHSNKTYTFPNTVTIVDKWAFQDSRVVSVRLNEGLKTLKHECFMSSRIRKLILPSSVESIGKFAFDLCEHLKYVDLSAAHCLKCIKDSTFGACKALKQVLLNEGLEKIRSACFAESGFQRISIPSTVKHIQDGVFRGKALTQVHFLGTVKKEPHREHSSGNTKNDCPESE